jgi:hypothetical protein
MKRMTRLFVFLVFMAGASSAYAHPASDIKITFDPSTRMLLAVITHGVSNPASHYIDKVDVALNGNEIVGHVISKQDDNVGQTVSYLIPDAKKGDSISVGTHCNKSGNLKKELTVE